MDLNKLKSLHEKMVNFIQINYFNDKFGRSFYAHEFAFLSLENMNKDKILERLKKDIANNINTSSENTHWQFLNYAILSSPNLTQLFSDYLKKIKNRKNYTTNWLLLKILNDCKQKKYRYFMVYIKLIKFLRYDNGFIQDSKNSKSVQYFWFSLFLLTEIYLLFPNKILKSMIIDSIKLLDLFVFPDGQTCTIGRGQGQIFGYFSLLASISNILMMNIISTEQIILIKNIQSKVFNYILENMHENGYIPLVLNKQFIPPESKNDLSDQRFIGWYQYNNFFDYYCFSTFLLTKIIKNISSNKLNQFPAKENLSFKSIYLTNEFIVFKNNTYQLILSSKTKEHSSSQLVPQIYNLKLKNKVQLLPYYGGEQFGTNLYQFDQNGLPISIKNQKITRLKYFSKFKNMSFTAKNNTLNFRRKYWLKNHIVIVKDLVVVKQNIDKVSIKFPLYLRDNKIKRLNKNKIQISLLNNIDFIVHSSYSFNFILIDQINLPNGFPSCLEINFSIERMTKFHINYQFIIK